MATFQGLMDLLADECLSEDNVLESLEEMNITGFFEHHEDGVWFLGYDWNSHEAIEHLVK